MNSATLRYYAPRGTSPGLLGEWNCPDLILDPYLRNAFLGSLMDGTLLWVAAAVNKHRTRWYRIAAGAMLGGLYNFWLALSHGGFLPGWSLLTSPLVLWLVCPALMLSAAFVPVGWRRFFQTRSCFLPFRPISWGLGSALVFYLGHRGFVFSNFLFTVLEIVLALVVAELGWGVVHERAMARVCHVPIAFDLGGLRVETDGYLDTGNHLCDPVTRKPVVVLDYSVVREFLTPGRPCICRGRVGGESLCRICRTDDPWLSRMRVIPYHSVQRQSGLMPGLRADWLSLGQGRQSVCHSSVVIGLELAGRLASDACRALVPPSLWSLALSGMQEKGRK